MIHMQAQQLTMIRTPLCATVVVSRAILILSSCTRKVVTTVRLSTSQRNFLLQATQRYAAAIEKAEPYLLSRQLSVDEAKVFHLGVVEDPLPGHEPYKGRLAIPYITPSGVVDIRFRSLGSEDPKYMGLVGAKTTMFNTQACFVADKYICVTEGEFDCIMMSSKTVHPTVGIPGANNWKPHYAKILDDFDIVIVLADGDAAGLEFGKKISRELGNVNIISMPEGEDVNSMMIKQGSDWVDERIRECIAAG
jgi:5S rRNA maturation endonuclease (ribonuclease M5)